MSSPLLSRFVGEARDLLQEAATGLLKLERKPDDENAINTVFRSVHTLKGSVGLFDFPAFTKLVHTGEDVLSAVRAGQLAMSSDLVDLLLDALDRMSAWVDAIEAEGHLPEGAGSQSKDLTVTLRALLPVDAAATAGPAVPAVREAGLGRISAIAEDRRLAAFRHVLSGGSLLAVEYTPAEDCFYSGEDPVALFRQLDPLFDLQIEPVAAWPALDDLDPYRCALRFTALTGTPRDATETVFRYVLEQVAVVAVAAHHLIVPVGAAGGGPVYRDFSEVAADLLEKADWEGLRRSVSALLELTGADLFVASALRWMLAVLAMPQPEIAWLEALVGCVTSGREAPMPPAHGTAPAAPPPAPDIRPQSGLLARLSPLGRDILDGQRIVLETPAAPDVLASRIGDVARTVFNVLNGIARHGDLDAWEAAVTAARESVSATPLLAALASLLGVAEHPAEPAAPVVAEAPEAVEGTDHRPAVNRVLKVDQGKIDTLMTLIGELVVSKNSLPFLARRAENVYNSRELSREIKDLYGVVDRLAQEMQEAIMAVRMLPVTEVLDRFPRLVRDVARKLGKHVELVVDGGDTAADKNIIEVLGDPLLHIIRNALDHGIESPERRVAAGKPESATVQVRAFQESDQVVIEVSDDGQGIDPAVIRRSAVAKGVIDAERASRLSDQEAVNLVFLPGFSTAAEVSDLSGRGVGMDVVRSTVAKANGTVSLRSTVGRGTTVRLALPLSMAVSHVMMVEAAGGMLFGIPMEQIAETVRVSRAQVRRIKQAETFVLRDTLVPLLRLDRLLGVEPSLWIGDSDQEDAVLVVRVNDTLTGLVVDHFREGMDIILKPFDGILSGIGGYSGTALLGDGRVLLVLNLKELL